VERQSLQFLRTGRAGLDRRRAHLRPRRPRPAAPIGLHARPRRHRRRPAMSGVRTDPRGDAGSCGSRYSGDAVRTPKRSQPWLLLPKMAMVAMLAASATLSAQDLLIRNATVHPATERGTLRGADVLVRNGRIAAVGSGLEAAGATVVEAEGRPVTPALFGGITGIGIEEVSGEDATVDTRLALGEGTHDMTVRPEFDVTLAYDPDSLLLPVARVEGIGFTLLAAGTRAGGSIIGGQGAMVRLDGSDQPAGPKLLFV